MDGLEVSQRKRADRLIRHLRKSSSFHVPDAGRFETLSTDALTNEYTLRPELMIYYGIDSNSSNGSSTASPLQISRIKAVDLSEFTDRLPRPSVFQRSGPSQQALYPEFEYGCFGARRFSQWLKFGASGVELVTTQSDATNIMLASSLDLIDVANNPGEDFNPTGNAWQTNAFAAWPTKDGVVEVTSIANSSLNSLRDGTD